MGFQPERWNTSGALADPRPPSTERVIAAVRELLRPIADQLARIQGLHGAEGDHHSYQPLRTRQEHSESDDSYVFADMVLEPENIKTIALLLTKKMQDSGAVDDSILDEVYTIVTACGPKRVERPIDEKMTIPTQYAILKKGEADSGVSGVSGISGDSFMESLENGLAKASDGAKVVILNLASSADSGASLSGASDIPAVSQARLIPKPEPDPSRSAASTLEIFDAREYVYRDESSVSAPPAEGGTAVQTSSSVDGAPLPGGPYAYSTGTPDLFPESSSLASLMGPEPTEESERAKLWKQFQKDLQYYPFYITTYQKCGKCQCEHTPPEQGREAPQAQDKPGTAVEPPGPPEPLEPAQDEEPRELRVEQERSTTPGSAVAKEAGETEPAAIINDPVPMLRPIPRPVCAEASHGPVSLFADQVAVSDAARGAPRRPSAREVTAVPEGVQILQFPPREIRPALARLPPRARAREASPELVSLTLPPHEKVRDVVEWVEQEHARAGRAGQGEPARVFLAAPRRSSVEGSPLIEIAGALRKQAPPSPRRANDGGPGEDHETSPARESPDREGKRSASVSPSPRTNVIDLKSVRPSSGSSSGKSQHAPSGREPSSDLPSPTSPESEGGGTVSQEDSSHVTQLSWDEVRAVPETPLLPDREAEELASRIMMSSVRDLLPPTGNANSTNVDEMTLQVALDATVDAAVNAVLQSLHPTAEVTRRPLPTIQPVAQSGTGEAREAGQKAGPLAASGVINPRAASDLVPEVIPVSRSEEYSYSYSSYSYSGEESTDGSVPGGQSTLRHEAPSAEGLGEKSRSRTGRKQSRRSHNTMLENTPRPPDTRPTGSDSYSSYYSSYSSESDHEPPQESLSALEREVWGPVRAPKIHLPDPSGGPSILISDPAAESLLSASALRGQETVTRGSQHNKKHSRGSEASGARNSKGKPLRRHSRATPEKSVKEGLGDNAEKAHRPPVQPSPLQTLRLPRGGVVQGAIQNTTQSSTPSALAESSSISPTRRPKKRPTASTGAPPPLSRNANPSIQNPSVEPTSSTSVGQVYPRVDRGHMYGDSPTPEGDTGELGINGSLRSVAQPRNLVATLGTLYAIDQDVRLDRQAREIGELMQGAADAQEASGGVGGETYRSGISQSLLATAGLQESNRGGAGSLGEPGALELGPDYLTNSLLPADNDEVPGDEGLALGAMGAMSSPGTLGAPGPKDLSLELVDGFSGAGFSGVSAGLGTYLDGSGAETGAEGLDENRVTAALFAPLPL